MTAGHSFRYIGSINIQKENEMSNNNFLRIAGYAGIASAVIMLVMTFTTNPEAPMTALSMTFSVASIVAGIVFAAGLYQFYHDHASGLSLAAVAITVIGNLLFLVVAFTNTYAPGTPLTTAADASVYIIGVALFSLLALQSGRMPRALAYIGFFTALVGVVIYMLMLGAKMAMTSPTVMVFYLLYLVGSVIWMAWTGVALLKPKAALATA
jgi:hypothetical protein